ncbi:aminotransferase class I/II-fold pyridoxal phosphate-dependent enzyme [Polymorphobacter fuscus]|uniref:Aminotransferase n=2 Tax=Sandarakinorhabdus fusca TaxID=1439888 RepID=A0A7C9KJV9_9SPHN|nr:aminotransferase class I/II-fold pyridoxal phosphate-dependent enzyme [Polymorphobacter fuscus]MQT16083.1 aminotransferase class I/II-fold pyridoxal phosphate-dependent enzyme [Polymorphobacter fuscus]
MQARASVADFAVHGGRLALARAAFPGRDDWIDLSTGISPWAYPAAIDPLALARLPEPAALAALESAAATVFGSDAADTVAVPGSDIALRLLGQVIAAKAPAVVGPGYSGHVAMWPGARVIAAIDADAHDALVLARPNNPDGAIASRDALAVAAQAMEAKAGWLIIDEAFADAGGAPSLATTGWPATIVLRSFGKFFGLAGLRLGFVVAPPAVAAPLRRLLGDWPLSGPAIAIGTAAYRDHGWQAAQRVRLSHAAAGLAAAIAAAGLAQCGGTSCFALVDTDDSAALFRHLAGQAILTRPFADQPRRLRIGLPADADQLARLAHALRSRSLS